MNEHRIDDVSDVVRTLLRASTGSGVNRKGGVYFHWSFPSGTKSIWIADEDIARYTSPELARHIAFELSRKRE